MRSKKKPEICLLDFSGSTDRHETALSADEVGEELDSSRVGFELQTATHALRKAYR